VAFFLGSSRNNVAFFSSFVLFLLRLFCSIFFHRVLGRYFFYRVLRRLVTRGVTKRDTKIAEIVYRVFGSFVTRGFKNTDFFNKSPSGVITKQCGFFFLFCFVSPSVVSLNFCYRVFGRFVTRGVQKRDTKNRRIFSAAAKKITYLRQLPPPPPNAPPWRNAAQGAGRQCAQQRRLSTGTAKRGGQETGEENPFLILFGWYDRYCGGGRTVFRGL
jgi:hypothetical protein